MRFRNNRAQGFVHVDQKSRRMFLKSAGGFTLAIPLMPSLLFSEKAMAAASQPLRYIHLHTPHGGLQNKNWFGANLPKTNFALYSNQNARVSSLASLATSSGLSPVLGASFNSLIPMMNIFAGVDQPKYFGHSRIAGLGAFAGNHAGTTNPSDQLDLSGIVGETPTIDQVLGYAGGNGIYGASLGSRRRFLNVDIAGSTSSYGRANYFDLSQPVVALDTISSTSGIFSTLFGSLPQGSTTTSTSTNPLLNLVNEFWPSGKSLMSSLSSADRSLLDQLFQLAQDASTKYSATQQTTCSSTKPAGIGNWDANGAQMQVFADMISMAFKCDLTRIVTIHMGDYFIAQNWHDAAHTDKAEAGFANAQTQMVGIHKMIADNLVARLGTNLNSAIDPLDSASSILKNSLIYWTHENKAAHDNANNPTLLIGGAGGRINTGLFADLRDMNTQWGVDITGDNGYQGDLINRLWVSIFYAMGINKADYEITRGGGSISPVMNKSYGHVLNITESWSQPPKPYNLTKIDQPWEFLMKSSTVWG